MDPSLSPGTWSSTLQLVLELGRGGMGVVYLALDRGPSDFAKLKVIKRLRTDFALEPSARRMFLDEARLSARLSHPNIVQTNRVGFDGEHYFLEMEYLEGVSLDALTRAAPMALRPRLWAFTQVLAGLHYAHELADLDGSPLRIVHRDVSPHNVFVTYDGAVKLLDFGIAKAAISSSETRTGMIKGKVTYMAPEQAAQRTVDRRADLFSVGVMLWEAIMGARLWGELGEFDILMKLGQGDIPPAAAPHADPELSRICARALAPSPDQRYATALELADNLSEYLANTGEPVSQKEVADFVLAHFGERRIRVRSEIKEHVTGGSRERLPVITAHDAAAQTSTGSVSATEAPPRGASGPRGPALGLRAIAAVSAGVALLAGTAVFVMGMRARGTTPVPEPHPVGAVSPQALGTCRSDADCALGGTPARCRKETGACVPLASEDCTVHADPTDLANDATIWFGVMMPMKGPDAVPLGAPSVNAIELARQDFAGIARGITTPSGLRRPLAFIACDDATSPLRAARHLIEDVHVPAVIGFHTSDELIALKDVFVQARTLAIASLNASPLLTGLPQPEGMPRFVWRTASNSTKAVAEVVARFVPQVLEPKLRAELGSRGAPSAAALRIALVRRRSTAGLGSNDSLFSMLRFNGKSVLENGSAFREFVMPSPGAEDGAAEIARMVDELVAFQPHVAILLGQDELTTPVLAPLEARWPRATPYRATYVYANTLLGNELFALLGKDAARRRRFFGVSAPSQTAANAKFTMHYNETFPDKVTLNTSPADPYDAFYLLAYAAFTLGDEEVTGERLARAFARLVPPGPPVDLGPLRIFEAWEHLRREERIDLTGAGSLLDLDLATGDSRTDYVIQCPAIDADGRAVDAMDSGLVFRANAGVLEGALECP